MTSTTPLMHLTRIDGAPIIIVKTQIVSWSKSLDHENAITVHLTNGHLQDVRETTGEIKAQFL